jgi:hypothetical protein
VAGLSKIRGEPDACTGERAAITKLEKKPPILSASMTAIEGPVIWRRPKMKVMSFFSGQIYSLTAATMMGGMDQATLRCVTLLGS